ncbi:uncharacterized protein MJAP1_002696 [Malassezia japonica]|uniref:Small ribosomal subunit protein uS7 domain-containing protein n=1 Tax=Malassezia japonica TaxID=223818 RepID=A0AAF0F4L6_9BASI|nr:uncharacterized protein MJAP1_002696 [Malassezia japonica]WFD39716.1 hypothetical protein MJAP1_002696 [Malassezia japonica]
MLLSRTLVQSSRLASARGTFSAPVARIAVQKGLPAAQVAPFSTSRLTSQEAKQPGAEQPAQPESTKVVLPGSTPLPSSVTPAKTFTYTLDTLPPRQDPLLQFIVNLLMKDGKKASAERYIADMLAHMAKLTNSDPLPLVYEAVELAKPILRMQSRKQGGKTMQVPIPLNARQSTRRAIVWIIEASRRRADRAISRRLAVEMLAVLEGNSSVLSRKDEAHKIGTVNRANASVRI